MGWLRRAAVLAAVASTAALALSVAEPCPPIAQANVVCEVGISPGTVVTGALGIGNPVGDACNELTDPVIGAAEEAALGPIKEAAESLGNSIFAQITSWVASGATWLLGEVVTLTEKTTSPNLLSAGFLRQYRRMAEIGAALALMMLLLACLEGLGRGDPGMLWRVFLVNVPAAALATSAAYVVVQMLVATTDGFSEVIAHSTAHDTREFFKSAIEALSAAGGTVAGAAGEKIGTGPVNRAAGSVEVPLFVGLIAAIVAAVAAFLVWIELLMRSAAIYAVALFMPLSLAASIWPRWRSTLRRTGELVVVVVSSKFVIVAIIALAASLAAQAGGSVEHVLTAGALLLLACFAPVVLFRLVPFAEGAIAAAYSRQGAGGVALRSVDTASSVSMMRRTALANWGGGERSGAGRQGGGAGGRGGGGNGPGGKGAGGGKGPAPGGGRAAGGSGGAGGGAAAGAGSAAELPLAAVAGSARAAKGAGKALGKSGTAQASGEGAAGARPAGAEGGGGSAGAGRPPAPAPAPKGQPEAAGAPPGAGSEGGGRRGGESAPQRGAPPASAPPAPQEAQGGGAPQAAGKPPRPGGEASRPAEQAPGGEGKQ